MSESYIDSIRSDLEGEHRRQTRVAQVADFLRGIILNHATVSRFDNTMTTRMAHPNPKDPSEVMWLELLRGGGRIPQAEYDEAGELRHLVPDEAALKITSSTLQLVTAFTVAARPPDVLGHDGSPLPLAGVAGVLVDLQRYRAALDNGETR